MSFLEAAILGLIQGITEFLPISSSGHLVLAQEILGISEGSEEYYILLLHLATLAAVILYFWKDIMDIIRTFLKHEESEISLISVVIGTIPAVIVSLLFESYIDRTFSSPKLVVVFLICTGLLLLMAQILGKSMHDKIANKNAFAIGWFQAFAILPGISRSGSTLAGGMILGIKAETALRFSFILSIPAILGAMIFKFDSILLIPSSELQLIGIGMFFAFVSALFSIKLLFKIVATKRLYIFSLYCWIIAAVACCYFI